MSDLSCYRIDAEKGVVYGIRGRPITKKVKGYVHIWNRCDASDVSISAHRLIWERVHGPVPEGMQINHKNGNKSDNRICNLELVTPSENLLHAYKNGMACAKGDRNGRRIGKLRELEKEQVA